MYQEAQISSPIAGVIEGNMAVIMEPLDHSSNIQVLSLELYSVIEGL